ncbi:cytochrome P450 71B10-like isoform X2 [Rhodamnia argentea]|uniref:Cytochrome P450 71B10-like isoform X2 n=1 Tax=Rhodamnia argentea TaxID=178133 RepID=A0ABM3HI98_9MYRT|nr:cytochrome P450 71B10-like isoform X2 [Rhodamnia argentea]
MALPILFTWLASLSLPALLLLLLLLAAKNFSSKKKNLPPGPPPLPIIGNLHQLGHLPHQSLWKLSRRYGPVMLVRLGGVPTIVVSSPGAAREVLKTHDLNCCSRPRLLGTGRLSYDYLDMAFVEYGDYWRELRKLCVLELFSAKQTQSVRHVREEEVGSMIESIARSAESGTPVNMSEKFMALTADITCRVAFGKAFPWVESNDGKFMDMIREAMAMLGSYSASDFYPRFGWIVDRFTGLHSRLEKSFHKLDVFYQKVIEAHRDANKSNEEVEDIVDLLLKMERDQTELAGVRLEKDNIKAILTDIFLAGVNTSALVMDWTMAELTRNPRVMQKVREEIRSCVGNKKCVKEDDLHRLKYLKLVLKEAMRLHPPGVLLLPRETMSQFKLFGYDVDPRSRVLVNVWGIGRDPNLWEQSEEFLPERFEDSPIDYKGNHFELLPFGAGRRQCPGMSMGMATIELTLANVLHSFHWELPEGMTEGDISMEEGAGIAVFKKVPLTLLPVKA